MSARILAAARCLGKRYNTITSNSARTAIQITISWVDRLGRGPYGEKAIVVQGGDLAGKTSGLIVVVRMRGQGHGEVHGEGSTGGY